MAQNPHYIHDLPFHPRRQLCRMLDADHRWEELGGRYMNIDITTLTLIGQAVQREKSPTWEVLNKFSEKNGTIKQLFVMLAKMDHQRGMTVLKPYVDQKYHALFRRQNQNTTTFSTISSIQNSSAFPSYAGTHNFTEGQNLLSQHHDKKNINKDQKSEGRSSSSSSSNNAKFAHDMDNINHSLSTVSLHSKLNSFNLHKHSPSNQCSNKRLHNAVHPKHEHYEDCQEESNTDNCASEKMKSISQASVSPKNYKLNVTDVKNLEKKTNEGDLSSLEESLPDVMKISYKDIRKATNDFDKSRILGKGGFGTVYKGEWKGTSVAIKRLQPREGHDSASRQLVSLKQSHNELKILKCCRFDHILPLYGVSLDGDEPCLIYQLMINGSLEDRLLCRNNTAPLDWSQRSHIAICTTKGLNYLHTTPGKPLVHGDIKSANILLDANMDAKIGDFGLAREGPGCQDTHVKVTRLHGTECYLPPEYLRHRQLSPQVDVYGYGIVLLEIATGLRPYDTKREEAKFLGDYVNDCDVSGRLDSLRDAKAGEENMMWFRELVQIGRRCSSKEKKKRPTMQEVLDYFDKVKEETSMMDKIRRLSNDKGTLGDTSKLKQLRPRELQIYYDMYKEKYGKCLGDVAMSNPCPPPRFLNEASFIPVSGLQDVKGPPSSNFHPSEIKEPPSVDTMEYPDLVESSLNSSCIATAGSCETHERYSALSNIVENSTEGKVPVPLLTVLGMKVSEVNENSDVSYPSSHDPENSDIYSDISSSGVSSHDLPMDMSKQ